MKKSLDSKLKIDSIYFFRTLNSLEVTVETRFSNIVKYRTLTKGQWDYKGFSGSIASRYDHGGGECIVMCTYGIETEKRAIENRIENLSEEELANDRLPENMEKFMQHLLKLCHTLNQKLVQFLLSFYNAS